MLGSVFCQAAFVQKNTLLSCSIIAKIATFIAFFCFIHNQHLFSPRQDEYGRIVDDFGNILDDSRAVYPGHQTMQRDVYNPDLDRMQPNFSSTMYQPAQPMYANPSTQTYAPMEQQFDGSPYNQRNPYAADPRQELGYAMAQGQAESTGYYNPADRAQFIKHSRRADEERTKRMNEHQKMMAKEAEKRAKYASLGRDPNRELFYSMAQGQFDRTSYEYPMEYNPGTQFTDPRAQFIHSQTSILESQRAQMQQEAMRAQQTLIRKIAKGREEENVNLQQQLAEQSQELMALRSEDHSPAELKKRVGEWRQTTSRLEAQLAETESPADISRESIKAQHAAFREQAALHAKIAAQADLIQRQNSHIDTVEAIAAKEHIKRLRDEEGSKGLTYHQAPQASSATEQIELLRQALLVKGERAKSMTDIHNGLIDQVSEKLRDKGATVEDFRKLLIRESADDGSLMPHFISGASLHRYFTTIARVYADHQKTIADLQESGTTAQVAAAQRELEQLNKLRTVLEERRQQDFSDAQDRYQMAKDHAKKLNANPGKVQLMRGTQPIRGNDTFVSKGVIEGGTFGEDGNFEGAPKLVRKGAVVAAHGINYTRLQAAKDRKKAIEKEMKRLKRAEDFTAETPVDLVEHRLGLAATAPPTIPKASQKRVHFETMPQGQTPSGPAFRSKPRKGILKKEQQPHSPQRRASV